MKNCYYIYLDIYICIWISKINKYSFSNIKRSNANTRVYVIEVLNKKKYI